MQRIWVCERLFYDQVIVKVKNEKKCNIKYKIYNMNNI